MKFVLPGVGVDFGLFRIPTENENVNTIIAVLEMLPAKCPIFLLMRIFFNKIKLGARFSV